MTEDLPRSPVRRTTAAFAVGALSGFLVGSFLVGAVVWRYGNVIGSKAASENHPAHPPAPVERWSDGEVEDHGGEGVLRGEGAGEAISSAATRDAVVVPSTPAETTLAGPAAAALLDRDLLVPVEGVSPGQLLRTFADRRGSRLHEAIDILAPRNTPVLAVEDGTVARLFFSKAGGITIYQFDPAERYTYYYAHLERYADGLAEGQRVTRGQVIGYVGVSGNAPKDTPHLHFAIFRLTSSKRWWEGTPIDPYDALK